MVNVGTGFVFSVLTLYALYQYFHRENELYGYIAYTHISFLTFFSIYVSMVVYTGSLIGGDVSTALKFVQFGYKSLALFSAK